MPDLKTSTQAASAISSALAGSEIQQNEVQKKKPGLSIRRLFTKPGVSPYDEVEWELRLAQITDAHGAVIFEQKDVEVQIGRAHV